MLDTNTCIYVIKRKPINVINRFRRIQLSQIGISSITLSELEYGVMKSSKPGQNQLALAQFLAPLEILSYDDEAARHYGSLRTKLEKRATPIGSLDLLFGAHALSAGCILITNNEGEFKRVQDLKVANWVN
jgi:tRNA(fMet)-specific endonuclease VapC